MDQCPRAPSCVPPSHGGWERSNSTRAPPAAVGKRRRQTAPFAAGSPAPDFAGDRSGTGRRWGSNWPHNWHIGADRDAEGRGHSPASLRGSPRFLVRRREVIYESSDGLYDGDADVECGAETGDERWRLGSAELRRAGAHDWTSEVGKRSLKVQCRRDRRFPSCLLRVRRCYRPPIRGTGANGSRRDGRQCRRSSHRRHPKRRIGRSGRRGRSLRDR